MALCRVSYVGAWGVVASMSGKERHCLGNGAGIGVLSQGGDGR